MFIYLKDKKASVYARGKSGTTNLHNHYWMREDNTSVGAYTEFENNNKWLFANNQVAVGDMVNRPIQYSTSNWHTPKIHGVSYTDGDRRTGMWQFEYITFLKTCRIIDPDIVHYLIIRDPLERFSSGVCTCISSFSGYDYPEIIPVNYDILNNKVQKGEEIDEALMHRILSYILTVAASDYHAQPWLTHLDKHLVLKDYNLVGVKLEKLAVFAQDLMDLDIKDLPKFKTMEEWYAPHTGFRAPSKRPLQNYIKNWIRERYSSGNLEDDITLLLDSEYRVFNSFTKWYE